MASILTHIAVFVPLLFLTGISSILFKQLSVVVIFSLLMSLLVAVTLVPVLCAYLLKLPAPVEERKGLGGTAVHRERELPRGHGRRAIDGSCTRRWPIGRWSSARGAPRSWPRS